MSSYLKYHRTNRGQLIGLPTTFDSITDNPLRHGATYVAIKTETTYKNQVTLFADLYAEHRGVSYGIFDRNNTVVFPVMRIELKDSLRLFKNTLHLSGKIGEFLDEKLDEGLTIYNLDVQGFQIRADYKNFILHYTVYGDLYNGIGLGIDDADHFSLQKELKNNSSIGVSVLMARPPYAPLKNNFNINLFASKIFKSAQLYGQVAYRPFDADFLVGDFSKKSALVTGIKFSGENKKFSHSLKAEARYYGYLFNFDYYNWDTVLYRRPATDINSNYANTVGPYLYPLRKFDTPFSQWAVFTEYTGSYVWSIGLSGNVTYHLSKKFDAFVDYDLNYINSHLDKVFADPDERNSSFLYPFMNAGFSYQPAENTSIKASVTDKAMNLDLNYPTFYLLKRPCVQVSVFAFFK